MLSPRPSSALAASGRPSCCCPEATSGPKALDGRWAPQDNGPAQSVSQRDAGGACTTVRDVTSFCNMTVLNSAGRQGTMVWV